MARDLNNELVRIHFQLFRTIKNELQNTSNLSLQQMYTLVFLKEKKVATVGEIAKNLNISIPTTTTLLDRLSQLKLASRKNDKKDRRVKRVALTKAGLKLLEKAIKERRRIIKRRLTKLSNPDKQVLLRIMKKLID